MKIEDIKVEALKFKNSTDELIMQSVETKLVKHMEHLKTKNGGYKFNIESAAILDILKNLEYLQNIEEIKLKEAFLSGIMSSKCLKGHVDSHIFFDMANMYIEKIKEANTKVVQYKVRNPNKPS